MAGFCKGSMFLLYQVFSGIYVIQLSVEQLQILT